MHLPLTWYYAHLLRKQTNVPNFIYIFCYHIVKILQPLPPDFMSFHLKNKIPNDMIIQSAKGGYSWRLKIKKIGEMYYFFNGWDKVVKDCKLGNRDFLVFTLVDHSTFKMVMYRPNECENVLKPKTKVEDVVVPRGDKAYDYDPFFTQVITATHRGVLVRFIISNSISISYFANYNIKVFGIVY